MSLAEAINADELLIDELAGRVEAERRKLHVTGTLGVLADAYVAGLIDFDRALARLRSTNLFRRGRAPRAPPRGCRGKRTVIAAARHARCIIHHF